ncbi:hypothetical protein EVC37_21795 [Methylocaldum sp. BRCS4]|nr:hypothetical protein [Methylocaldum sp. BRCS4]
MNNLVLQTAGADSGEAAYRDALIRKGLSIEDAAAIAAKTKGIRPIQESKKTAPVPENTPLPVEATPKKRNRKATGEVKKMAIVNAAVEISTNPIRAEEPRDTAWGAKCLVAAALPYRNPKPEQLQNGAWVRRNGNYTLWVQGGPEGLPYGAYPRVFMIWLTTEAVRSQSRRIETGRSFWDFCRKVKIDPSRGKRGSGRLFIDQATRLLSSRAAFITGSFDEGRVKKEFLQFAEGFELFFDTSNIGQTNLFESEILLTEKFYNEITTHNIPLDIRAVAALKQSPLELDIYQWLAYRMHNLKGRTTPTWHQLYDQFGASHKELRFFKRDFLKSLHAVKQVYEGVKIDQNDKGLILLPSPTPVPKKTG